MEVEFAPQIEEIKRALGSEIDIGSIIADLKELLKYRVPIDEAKRSLIKKYGGAEKSTIHKLKDIEIGDQNIELTAQIVEISRRTINVKNVEKTIFSGIIRDETDARSFTAWQDFGLNPGDVINITQAYVRNWQDTPEIHIGNKSKITKLNTPLAINQESMQKKLSELKGGEVNIYTVFTILSIEQRDINTKSGSKKILRGIAADEDAKLPFTSWVILPQLESGNTVEVKNAYVRSFLGIPSLNINENSTVIKLDKKIQRKEPARVMIGDIVEKEGAFDIVIEGNILSIRSGSGLIARCPECSRVIQKGICRVHGKVNEKMDMRIKAVIDDGTGALMLVLDSELTQKLCGLTIDDAKQVAKKALSQSAVEEEIKKKLLGKMLNVRGNMSKSDFGMTFVASNVCEPDDNIKQKAIELLGQAV